ncbi:MAG: hypothetical protein AB7S37_02385 [Methanobacteriales archaeon]|nr:hypothetical protein [Methanothermobacter sp.]
MRGISRGDEITKYATIEGEMQKTADILPIVGSDYKIYDELAKKHELIDTYTERLFLSCDSCHDCPGLPITIKLF